MSDYSNFHKGKAKNWAEHYQPEIDSIRSTGKYEPSTWDKIKNGVGGVWNEAVLDGAEFVDTDFGFAGDTPGSSKSRFWKYDEIRDGILEQERAKALQDYKNRNLPPMESRKNPPGSSSTWMKLRDKGEY